MSSEAGHIQITEFNKEVIPSINYMMEDLFCQYGVSLPWFMCDFEFPDYSERPDWCSGYNFNLDWGEWGYWLTWFNEMLGLLFDEAHLPRWQMPDLSPGSWAFFNDYTEILYDNMQRHYVYGQSGTFIKDEVIEGETSGITGWYKWIDGDGYIHVANKKDSTGESVADFEDEKIVGADSGAYAYTYEDYTLRVYIADSWNDRIVILDSNLNWIDSFNVIGCPYGVAVDQDYIYVSCAVAEGTNSIYKFNKQSPYTLVTSAQPSFEYNVYDIDQDSDYIYLGSIRIPPVESSYVKILDKSDLSLVDEFSTEEATTLYGIAVDDDYIYCSGVSTHLIKKYDKSDHSLVDSVQLGDLWQHGLGLLGGYLYVAGDIGDDLWVLDKSDLSEYKHYVNVCTQSWDVASYGTHAYMTDNPEHIVRKIKISDGSEVGTFGETGISGSDASHLNEPWGIYIG